MTKITEDTKYNTIRFSDILPKLLSISWRIPSIIRSFKEIMNFTNDTPLSMGSVFEYNAEVYSNKTAILFEDVQHTYSEFNEGINKYANYFLSEGIKKGDVVVVMVDNRPELLMIIGAMAKIGAISSLINPKQRGDALAYSINLTKNRHFIIGEELFHAVEEIKSKLEIAKDDVFYYQPDTCNISCPPGFINLPDVLQFQPTSNPPTTSTITLGDPFAYVFTSGTTGLPKASIQTHRKWLTGSRAIGKILMNFKPEDVHYCPLPFCHTNALLVSWGPVAGAGATLAIRKRFSASQFLNDVRKFKANSFIYIGEICRYLMNQPPKPDDKDNPLKACLGNGLRSDLWLDFKKRFGIKKVFEIYGAAEGNLVFFNLLNIDCTVGLALKPFAVVRYDVEENKPVRDQNGMMQKVKKGEVGLLISEITESTPFAGYKDSKETEKKILCNVFKTGDTWFDWGDLVLSQGFKHIQFVDRIGDTFRWKGENVSTGEVEKIIHNHDQISEVIVYGVRIPGTEGRAGMATIVPTTAVDDFDLNALSNVLNEGLPHYAIPKFLRFVKFIKATATHKVKKHLYREEAFDPKKVSDPMYVQLPNSQKYILLTVDLYKEIIDGNHTF